MLRACRTYARGAAFDGPLLGWFSISSCSMREDLTEERAARVVKGKNRFLDLMNTCACCRWFERPSRKVLLHCFADSLSFLPRAAATLDGTGPYPRSELQEPVLAVSVDGAP